MWGTLYKLGEVHFRLLGTNVFHVKTENERFTARSSRCRQSLKYGIIKSSFGRLHKKHCSKKRAAHVARLFFPIQPIKSLNCGGVVAFSSAVARGGARGARAPPVFYLKSKNRPV